MFGILFRSCGGFFTDLEGGKLELGIGLTPIDMELIDRQLCTHERAIEGGWGRVRGSKHRADLG